MDAAPTGTDTGILESRTAKSRIRPHVLRRCAGLLVVVAVLAGALAWFIRNTEPIEPSGVDQVDRISLRDSDGRMKALMGDRNTKAVVLFFLGVECPVSNGYATEMTRLASSYGPRGVVFRGVIADRDTSIETAARHRKEHGLEFPVVLDPERDVADQTGVTVTPEAVVLDEGGRIAYRGRIDDRYTADGRRLKAARIHDVSDALDALLAGHSPRVARTEAFGCPLPELRVTSAGEEVTYAKHVAPILWKRCTGCHRPADVGPFSLLTYEDAAKRSTFIHDVTASRRMPPWKPRHGFGEFLDEARLSNRELATLAAWAEAGAPEGDPSQLPAPPSPATDQWHLGTPDLVLQLPEPYVVPPSEDVYRAFTLPMPLDRLQPVSAVEFRPDNRRVVHHARFYLDPTHTSRARDQADPAPGFATIGGNDLPLANLGAWNPGVTPRMPLPGVGYTFQPGADFVLLVHYHGAGKPELDRSSVGIYFAKEPITRSMQSIPLSTARIDIPPGEPGHRITLHATLPADVHAYNVMPHGHYLMRQIKLWATLPGGTTRRLLWINDWDLNWQGLYHFAEPVALPKGTKLHVVAIYDNSDANPFNPNRPPKRVRFGPASSDEMLGCHIQILTDRPEDEPVVRKKWPFSL